MNIEIKVKPNSGKSEIIIKEGSYIAFLKSPPEDNEANIELLKLSKKYFKKDIRIIFGKTSKNKVLELF